MLYIVTLLHAVTVELAGLWLRRVIRYLFSSLSSISSFSTDSDSSVSHFPMLPSN